MRKIAANTNQFKRENALPPLRDFVRKAVLGEVPVPARPSSVVGQKQTGPYHARYSQMDATLICRNPRTLFLCDKNSSGG